MRPHSVLSNGFTAASAAGAVPAFSSASAEAFFFITLSGARYFWPTV